MLFYGPIWLVALIPLAILHFSVRLPTRILNALRITAVVLLVLALARPALRIPGRIGTVVVVADRSESMPPESLDQQKEVINIVQTAKGSKNLLAVVSFGRRASVEQPPQVGEFAGFVNDTGGDQSNLGEGIDLALSLIPEEEAGRILVLSDGRWTGKDPAARALRCATREVAVDFRLQQRHSAGDTAIHRVIAPQTVLPNESYVLNAWIFSPVQQEVTYEMRRGQTIMASGKRAMRAGLNRLAFRDKATAPGTCSYLLSVRGTLEDPFPENNQARTLVGVRGARPVLCVSRMGKSGLADLLRRGRVDIKDLSPSVCRWTLEELSGYSAVLLENTSANDIGPSGMETISAWIEQTGAGLMMTGGRQSFGPGGYFRSPLDRILPISMEIKKEHRKFSLALVVVMDRSGSMAMSAGGGRTKMDLVNVGAVQVLDLLSDMDEIGILAVDSTPHKIVALDTVAKNRSMRNKILRIESMGGGIFVYQGLTAAVRMLLKAKAGTRHIILFSDAADSEEPGKYKALLAKCAKANITVSVIGLGTTSDSDADFLIDIAKRGNGQCFFTADASEIPRLFAQDTFTVTRSAMVDEETAIKFTGGYTSLARTVPKSVPNIGGYNLCYLKPGATLSAVSVDEYKSPIVASWYAGSGRVLCYTGEADGEFTGPIAKWPGLGECYSSLVRWTSGDPIQLPGNMLLLHKVLGGICRIELHLDPARKEEPISEVPKVRVLQGVPGGRPTSREVTMRWNSADLLVAEIPLAGRETALCTVAIPGLGPVTLSPVCLPYSPEFKPPEEGRGRIALERLAKATGGKERMDLPGIWKSLPTKPHYVEFSQWLILAALALFILEILQRRTGLLSSRRYAGVNVREKRDREQGVDKTRLRAASPRQAPRASWLRQLGIKPRKPKKEEKTDTDDKDKPGGALPSDPDQQLTLDAMRQAQNRSRRRLRRWGRLNDE